MKERSLLVPCSSPRVSQILLRPPTPSLPLGHVVLLTSHGMKWPHFHAQQFIEWRLLDGDQKYAPYSVRLTFSVILRVFVHRTKRIFCLFCLEPLYGVMIPEIWCYLAFFDFSPCMVPPLDFLLTLPPPSLSRRRPLKQFKCKFSETFPSLGFMLGLPYLCTFYIDPNFWSMYIFTSVGPPVEFKLVSLKRQFHRWFY